MKTTIQPTQKRKRKGFTLVELLVVIAIIASLAGLSYGPIMRHLDSAARSEAISNGKNVHSALLGFMGQNDNSFPNDDTARGGTADTAEACLQQLIDGGFVSEEKYFWNKANGKADICDIKKPDNNGTLEASENVWGYTKNLDPGSDGSSPILFDCCKSVSASTASFTTLPWKGKAIIIRVDGSCKALDIDYGVGQPLDENGDGKEGAVTEKRGGASDADIFAALPSYAEPFSTSK